MKATTKRNITAILMLLLTVQQSMARCGGVDYSWGANSLASMHDYVVTMILYVLFLVYAIASIVVLIAATMIYMKMMNGEQGVTKQIMSTIGACMYLVGATIVFPAFFGYII